ncbi:MAG: ABC transporter ATP-binding protein [Thermomicrobiales bacterium]|nr:ABC transporter ATP-binding protein [Thermomicrobiales bacterium]
MADRPPLLIASDVQVFYGMSHVLHGATLDIPEGEVTALVGRNGVGKTTLVNAIAGLVPVQSGLIDLNGTDLTKLPATARRGLGIGLVPQGRRIFRNLTVDEHLSLAPPSATNPFTREWIYETFPRLHERRSSMASNLSGGEQSMLAISRALTIEPKLLIMDEPTEGLAPLLVETVRQVIDQLRAQQLTVLLVEQNLNFAHALADRVAIMDRGVIEHLFTGSEIPDTTTIGNLIISGTEH